MVPRAGLGADEIDRMLDLYFGLLRKNGVTMRMLQKAQEAYVMAPKRGKARFFPDPGELFELCADEARQRTKAVAALTRALAIIDGTVPPAVQEQDEPVAQDIGSKFKGLCERMRAGQPIT